MEIARKVAMRRAKTKASRKIFIKQKVIYKTLPPQDLQPTVNNLQLRVNQTCTSKRTILNRLISKFL